MQMPLNYIDSVCESVASAVPSGKTEHKRALSPDEGRNWVYQCETSCYIERISQSPLEFNSDASSFREFLESEQKGFYVYRWLKGLNGQG
jgi:hypothetical protein